ncbi:hypothetical protein [Neobacillus sp. Marseille-QA0830]
MFNEYGEYQLMKFRKKEVERNARTAWKVDAYQSETFVQKLVKKYIPEQPLTIVESNGNCMCCC